MLIVELILLVFAFVLAVCAAAGVPPAGRWQWGWLGFACYVAAIIVGMMAGGGVHMLK